MPDEVVELGEIVVCCGPPNCMLQNDDAIEEMENGCPMCTRIVVMSDGTEREYRQKPN